MSETLEMANGPDGTCPYIRGMFRVICSPLFPASQHLTLEVQIIIKNVQTKVELVTYSSKLKGI